MERRKPGSRSERSPRGLSTMQGTQASTDFDILPGGRLRFRTGHPSDSVLGIRRGEQIQGAGKKANPKQGRW